MIASLLNCATEFTLDVFSSEELLLSWTYLLKKTSQKIKILIFPAWNKFLKICDTLLEIVQIEVLCSKNYFNFLSQEAIRASEITETKLQKPQPKLKKYILSISR